VPFATFAASACPGSELPFILNAAESPDERRSISGGRSLPAGRLQLRQKLRRATNRFRKKAPAAFQGVGALAPTKNNGAQRLPFAAQFPRVVDFRLSKLGHRESAGLACRQD
jgi:hypothetical protein